MDSLPQDSTLAGELVDAARRDIETYINADDPNRVAAGQAALHGLNAAIRVLGNVRHQLLVELNEKTGREPGIRNPGNSGPGF
jgi:selenocysteine lyase/cysteine desulfurase